MSWFIGVFLLVLVGTAGAVIVYHRNLGQPVPQHLASGMVRIGAGLALLLIAGRTLHLSWIPGVAAAETGILGADSPVQGTNPLAASAKHFLGKRAAAPTPRTVPRVSTSPKPSATHHLGLTLDQLKRRLGPGRWAESSATTVTHPRLPGMTRQLGTAWGWDEGDYNLTCFFGPDGICRQATFSRSLNFSREQAVTIIRAEIGDERPVAVPGQSHEAVTRNGIIIRAGQNAHSITFEAPELAQLRAALVAEMEAERHKPIQVR